MLLFQLGSNAALSLAEIQAVLGKENLVSCGSFVLLDQNIDELKIKKIQDLLGGTVKIASVFATLTNVTQEKIEQTLEKKLSLLTQTKTSLEFAIGELGRDHLPRINTHVIKNNLVGVTGKSIKYYENCRAGLGAAVLLHKKQVVELLACRDQKAINYLAQTVSVQDIDFWSLRDRGKPIAQHKRGLLTPKVARILLNLSLGQEALNLIDQPQNTYCLLDPFCGSGTIPFEAIGLGFHEAIGCDISQEAIDGSLANLEWFKSTFNTTNSPDQKIKFLLSDATQLEKSLKPNSVSHLVTEPFLGKQTPNPKDIPNIIKGLQKLYLGSFKAWKSILKPKAKVVILFPRFNKIKNNSNWDNLVSTLASHGYKLLDRSLSYGKLQAQVTREIWQFELQK